MSDSLEHTRRVCGITKAFQQIIDEHDELDIDLVIPTARNVSYCESALIVMNHSLRGDSIEPDLSDCFTGEEKLIKLIELVEEVIEELKPFQPISEFRKVSEILTRVR